MAGAGVKVGIVGASGYTGAELLRLAAQHPDRVEQMARQWQQREDEIRELASRDLKDE